ncbi:hypothetical protein PF002_g24705 [Phytophthora fragariae]|uniref:Sulfatase N-terminal domain-containing protein n=1 Tax=Phytophthora fragariae TaxID=53985 RepID=A0A6A4C3F3_9STRA|nr:hypothetical protein PF011_g22420 [Phytophthora fragariae]KAE9190686.1 hypothetical protein PF002_g24705 [Phytophthora fragariae]KAE9283310.1 hypothetical protein PF001_g22914 [Phytophthora fragariae]
MLLRPYRSHWLQTIVYLRVHRWTDWALLTGALLLYGLVTRLLTLPVVLDKWANAWQQTWWVALLGLLLGAMEDLCVCVVMLATLWSFDYLTLKPPAERHRQARRRREKQRALAAEKADVEQGVQVYGDETDAPVWAEAVVLTEQFGRLAVYTLVFLFATGGLCLDSVFLRGRKMRFSADFVAMYFRERDAAGELEIDAAEWRILFWTTLFTVLLCVFVGLLGACWINLMDWDVLRFVHRSGLYQQCVALGAAESDYGRLHDDKEDDADESDSSEDSEESDDDDDDDCSCLRNASCRLTPRAVLVLLVTTFFFTTLSLAKMLPTVVGLIALNPVLSEPVRLGAGVQFVAERSSRSINTRPITLSHIIRTRQFAQNVAKQHAERDAAAAKMKIPSNVTEKPLPVTTASTKPWFATHYTISSHVPFHERPDWFFRYATEHREEMDQFAPLYEGHEHEELIRDYVQMRYFSDMVFSRFMEQLEKDNVLKDTIVVVVGDHGQAPELGSATPEQDQIASSRVAGAIIAEGRIKTPVVIDDAASQSDMLNTLADIVGLPVGGLLQTGIGRSLKRVPPKGVGKRVAFSNNPATNLAAVVGNIRLHFFADGSDAVRAYHTQRDPRQKHDLMGELSDERVRELLQICAEGRALNAYFKHRWDNNCLLQPICLSS